MSFKEYLVDNGLVCIDPNDAKSVEFLANMMGISFLEERWTQCLLDSIADKERVSKALMYSSMKYGSQDSCIYALDNLKACAACYASWELDNTDIATIEGNAFNWACKEFLNLDDVASLKPQYELMEKVSDFTWQNSWISSNKAKYSSLQEDKFIHIYLLGVDASLRGSGAFRKLISPILEYAQEKRVPCFLETYSPQLESLYEHFGFQTVIVHTDPQVDIIERGMVLLPATQKA